MNRYKVEKDNGYNFYLLIINFA